MIAFWISGFIIGNQLAHLHELSWTLTPIFRQMLLLFIGISIHFYWSNRPSLIVRVCFWIVGMIWGLNTGGVSLSHAKIAFPIQVIASNIGCAGKFVKVKDARGETYLVKRQQAFGEEQNWGTQLKIGLKAQLMNLDSTTREWLNAFILGDEDDLSGRMRVIFQRTGMLHFLVVSGQHLNLLSWLFQRLVLGPFWILNLLTLMRAQTWYKIKKWTRWGCLVALFIYSLMVGFDPSCQRAFLFYAVSLGMATWTLDSSLWGRISGAFFLQTILFPCDALSLSSLMSWGATIVLTAWSLDQRHAGFGWLRQFLWVQIPLGFLSLWAFNSFYRTSIFNNILIELLALPIFFISVLILAVSMAHINLINDYATMLLKYFFDLMHGLARLEEISFNGALMINNQPLASVVVALVGVYMMALSCQRIMNRTHS